MTPEDDVLAQIEQAHREQRCRVLAASCYTPNPSSGPVERGSMIRAIVEYQVGEVTVRVDNEAQMVRTTWPDGTHLDAKPQYDDESRARARELGYAGPDAVWQMTRDHDLAHHMLAVARGKLSSEHLLNIADGQPSPDGHDEECIVLLLQRVKNQGLA